MQQVKLSPYYSLQIRSLTSSTFFPVTCEGIFGAGTLVDGPLVVLQKEYF